MAIMDLVHVWFRPFRDELSLTRDDGMDAQNGKRTFRRKFGETDSNAWRLEDAPPTRIRSLWRSLARAVSQFEIRSA
jgi:hypothetical protein